MINYTTPPGKGIREIVQDPSLYQELSQIKDWRKILSKFYPCVIKYGGYTYNSVEHVFQGKKIEIADKEKGFLFTRESGSPIGLGDARIAKKNREIVRLNPSQLAEWNRIRNDVLLRANAEKARSCPLFHRVLLATRYAELWEIKERSLYLENIRDAIQHREKLYGR